MSGDLDLATLSAAIDQLVQKEREVDGRMSAIVDAGGTGAAADAQMNYREGLLVAVDVLRRMRNDQTDKTLASLVALVSI